MITLFLSHSRVGTRRKVARESVKTFRSHLDTYDIKFYGDPFERFMWLCNTRPDVQPIIILPTTITYYIHTYINRVILRIISSTGVYITEKGGLTLYPAYTRVGRGNLVLWHSVTVCRVMELKATLPLSDREIENKSFPVVYARCSVKLKNN